MTSRIDTSRTDTSRTDCSRSTITKAKCLINGIAADYINIDDRALHYGDGLFETLLYADNKIHCWSLHYQRLKKSAEKLKISCPHEDLLLLDIKHLLSNIKNTCSIKIILTRGRSQRGYQYDKTISSNRLVFLAELSADYSSLLSGKLLSGDLFLCEHHVSINKNLAGLKHLNRLDNVLAHNEWRSASTDKNRRYIDGLMLNHYSHVIEGTMSNLFVIKDGTLTTPDLSLSGVAGITRQLILNLADELNIKSTIKDITINDLMQADELFISNSLIGIKSVCFFNERIMQKSDITKIIFDALASSMDRYAEAVE